MNATATEINRAVPEWLETPEHEECEYTLMFVGADGGSVQNVDMTRAEFTELKRHLAEMRGLDAETAEEESAAPSLQDIAETTTERMLVSHAKVICGEIRTQASNAIKYRERWPAKFTSTFGDLALLHSIIDDWETGGCVRSFPGDLPIVAAIRGNLDL